MTGHSKKALFVLFVKSLKLLLFYLHEDQFTEYLSYNVGIMGLFHKFSWILGIKELACLSLAHMYVLDSTLANPELNI